MCVADRWFNAMDAQQIVGIGEDFHSQVDGGEVKTTLYKFRWKGYDRKGDTWNPSRIYRDMLAW